MTVRGKYINGSIVLDHTPDLAEGSEVECNITPLLTSHLPLLPGGQGLHSDLMQFAGIIKGTPPDASANLDKYLDGIPTL